MNDATEIRQIHLVFDCADPQRVSEFWRAAMIGYDYPGGGLPPDGYPTWDAFADAQGIPEDQRNVHRTLIDTKGDRPDIHFLRVPESKTVKNRLHIDLKVPTDERPAEIDRLTGLGAEVVGPCDEGVEGTGMVLRDVEGNEFCVT